MLSEVSEDVLYRDLYRSILLTTDTLWSGRHPNQMLEMN